MGTNASTAPDEYKILLEKTKFKKLQEEKEIRKLHAEKENTKPFQNEQLSSGRRRLPDQRRDRATERLARHCGNLWASTKAKIAALQRGFQAALLPQTDESPTASPKSDTRSTDMSLTDEDRESDTKPKLVRRNTKRRKIPRRGSITGSSSSVQRRPAKEIDTQEKNRKLLTNLFATTNIGVEPFQEHEPVALYYILTGLNKMRGKYSKDFKSICSNFLVETENMIKKSKRNVRITMQSGRNAPSKVRRRRTSTRKKKEDEFLVI